QYKIENSVANGFAVAFYESLLKGRQPVDVAVKEGRETIASDEAAFRVPVVYLQSYHELINADAQDKSKPAIDTQPAPPYNGKCPRPKCEKPIKRPDQKLCTGCGLRFRCQKCNCLLDDPFGNNCGECGYRIVDGQAMYAEASFAARPQASSSADDQLGSASSGQVRDDLREELAKRLPRSPLVN